MCPLGQWTFHESLGGRGDGGGKRICFPFSQWEGPRCLAFVPFKFAGVGRIFFSFFSVSQCVSRVFPLSS